jgi:hypothetical protein
LTGLTSGHVSVVSGSLSPLIDEHTVELTSIARPATSALPMGPTNKTSEYYLKLWNKVLKRKNYNLHFTRSKDSMQAVLRHKDGPVILKFFLTDPESVKYWYINFRLCGDDLTTFLNFQSNFSSTEGFKKPEIVRK